MHNVLYEDTGREVGGAVRYQLAQAMALRVLGFVLASMGQGGQNFSAQREMMLMAQEVITPSAIVIPSRLVRGDEAGVECVTSILALSKANNTVYQVRLYEGRPRQVTYNLQVVDENRLLYKRVTGAGERFTAKSRVMIQYSGLYRDLVEENTSVKLGSGKTVNSSVRIRYHGVIPIEIVTVMDSQRRTVLRIDPDKNLLEAVEGENSHKG